MSIGGLVAAMVATLLVVTPAAAQELDSVDVREDAPTPDLADPNTLPDGVARPPDRTNAAVPVASPQAAGRVAEVPARNARSVLDRTSGRFIVFHSDGLLALSDRGDVRTSSSRVLPPGAAFWDGDVFLKTTDVLYEVDPGTLAVVEHAVPFASSVAALPGELWTIERPDPTAFTVIDRTSGASRSVAFPAGIDVDEVVDVSHAPGIGSRVVVNTYVDNTHTAHVIDVSVEPVVLERSFPGDEAIGFGTGPQVFLNGLNTGVVETASVDTGAIEATATFSRFAGPWIVVAPGAEMLLNDGELRRITGELVRANVPASAEALSADGRHVATHGSGSVDVWHLGPEVDGAMQAVFQPGWYDQLDLIGDGLDSPVSVTVNGRSVPFEPSEDGRSLSIDVTSLPDTTSADGVVSVNSALGTATLRIPAYVARGRAVISVRAIDVTPTNNTEHQRFEVNCQTEQVVLRLGDGDHAVADVPGGQECLVSGPQHDSRSGYFSPGDATVADTNGSFIRVLSGRPAHVQFWFDRPYQQNGDAPLVPIWIYTASVGGGSDDLVYPIDVTCGSFSQRVNIRAGFGARLQPPPSEQRFCTARLVRKRGAARVSSFQLDSRSVEIRSGRSIEFEGGAGAQGQFVLFLMDFGEAEITIPQVIGVPHEDIGNKKNAGMVHVLPTDGLGLPDARESIRFRQGRNGLGGKAEPGDRFGEATVVADFDGDGWLDIAISAPGEDLGRTKNAGIVHVIYGSATGFKGTRRQTFHQNSVGIPDHAQRGERFGEALAVVDYDGNGYPDLAIGVPGERIDGKKRAGMVQIISGGPNGLDPSRWVETITQDSPGVATDISAGDEFGAALAAWRTYLVVGVPGEDVDGENNAGGAHIFEGVSRVSIFETQTRRKGVPEAGDRYGSSVGIGDRMVVIGAPGEDRGSRNNVGFAMRVYIGESGLDTASRREISMRTMNLQLSLPAGARFGQDVIVVGDIRDGDVVITAPGDTVDGRKGAGRVFVAIDQNGGGWWDQDLPGVPGSPTTGAEFGASVDLNRRGGLLIAAPGQSVNGRSDAGIVYATYDGRDWTTIHQDRRGVSTRAEVDDGFGASLGS